MTYALAWVSDATHYAFYFLIALGILIFVHEFGHFLVARRLGVGVTKFSFGFGPKIFGVTRGETEYLVSAIPLGGYVKLVGENEGEEIPPALAQRSFHDKPVWVRMAVVGAGPAGNLLFAVLVFWVVFLIGVPTLTTRVGEVVAGSPAERAGIRAQDLVVRIGDREVSTWDDLALGIRGSGAGRELPLTVRRDGKEIRIVVVPEVAEGRSAFGESTAEPKIGIISGREVVTRRYDPASALVRGVGETGRLISLTAQAVVKLVLRVIPADTVGGPLLIAQIAGDQARQGVSPFVHLLGLLSVNLGILNLLPIPILDGGHLLFFTIEGLRRKPLSPQARALAQQVGLAVILMLTALVFYNDITRLIAR